jgi:hypothetical protein
VIAGCGVDQLTADTHAATGLPHAAFEHIAHAELAPDLFYVDRAALVGEGRVSGDDEQRRVMRQRGDDLLDHTVGEIFLLWIGAQVLKWQHRNRRLVGQG